MNNTTQTTPARRPRANAWTIAYLVILGVAIVTRLYVLGDRAVSHDETTHAKYAWNLYIGNGFRPDPLMHGPLLFEATALMYALFGVSDFTARLYTALTGIALVMTPWLFRRWLGRVGALLASLLLLISPAITYYSRYTRHDIPILLFSVLLIWSVLRYLTDGRARWLRWMGVFFALMYASKENAYLYTAIFLGLLALPMVWFVVRTHWEKSRLVPVALAALAVVLLATGGVVLALRAVEFVPNSETDTLIGDFLVPWWGQVAVAMLMVAALSLVVIVTRGVGEARMRDIRLFDVLMVLASLTLPLGSAALMKFVAGVDMAFFYQGMMVQGLASIPTPSLVGGLLMLGVSLGVGIAMGLWWNRKVWPLIALAHYAVLFVFFTTFFTVGVGILTGLVGGLMYWLGQQSVDRGSQPWYYYGVIGPLYEYFAIFVSTLGGLWIAGQGAGWLLRSLRRDEREVQELDLGPQLPKLFPYFLLGWALLSWVAYAVAGEKMPWLFVHIAFPHIWLAAWALGRLFRGVRWHDLIRDGGWVLPIALFFLWRAWAAFEASSGTIAQVLRRSGAGEDLAMTVAQLQPLGQTLGGLLGIIIFSGLTLAAINRLGLRRSLLLSALTLTLLLGAFTVRTMVMLNYLNDELATEFLVYAHATPDVNEVLDKIERMSWRLTGTPDELKVAYGSGVAWPFYWYIDRLYPNYYYFVDPDPEQLLASPVVLAARSEWSAVEEILGGDYDIFDYEYIWWPIEDYKGLTWERITTALTDPVMRRALWDIIWRRDYERYARLKDPDNPFTLAAWPHRSEFRFYVRRDLSERVWDYELEAGQAKSRLASGDLRPQEGDDPYHGNEETVAGVLLTTLPEASGRGLAVAPDGSLYVSDAALHRVWHVTPEGEILSSWGGYGVGPGQFNHPSDIAVDAAGHVYVADTWNHRIQEFDADGTWLLSWGRYAEVPPQDSTGYGAFFGPRGVAVGPTGNVYVADTGNDRVQVFDPTGRFLRAFTGGTEVADPEGLREPTDIAVSEAGELFVADSANRRIQVFDVGGIFLRQWDVPVWGVVDPNHRPRLAVGADRVFATDPAYERLMVFDPRGTLLALLRDPTMDYRPGGIVFDGEQVYVTNARGGDLLVYRLEETAGAP